jgi:hypothetical protein
MSENQKLLITDPCDSVTVSDIKPGKRGLNKSAQAHTAGGGGSVLTHYLIMWLETDGQLSTRDGSSGRPGALLEISFPTQNSSTPYLTYMHCFLWLGKTNIADTTTGDTTLMPWWIDNSNMVSKTTVLAVLIKLKISVRYHDDGSKKLNACIWSLSHMVYL